MFRTAVALAGEGTDLCFEIGFDRLDGGTGSEAADTWVVVADTLASPWEVSGASWLKSMSARSIEFSLQVKVHSRGVHFRGTLL